jgi:hypothetical protein
LFCYPGKVADRILGADLPGHDVGFEEESYFLRSSLECVFFFPAPRQNTSGDGLGDGTGASGGLYMPIGLRATIQVSI